MSNEVVPLSAEELAGVDASLVKGMINRASAMSFIYAIAFSSYSFTSLEFLRKFDPEITLFSNTWPRLIFNALPFLLIGFFLRNQEKYIPLKRMIWNLGLPALFVAACLIHVWPIIWSGKPEVYLYVHSANVFILVTSLIVVAPAPRDMTTQLIAFTFMFAVPLCLLFLRLGNVHMVKFVAGDLAIGIAASAYATHTIYRLRAKLSRLDRQLKKSVSPFLGSALADAIYNQKSNMLSNRFADAVVVMMDIRGYTDFYKNMDPTIVRGFMTSYHAMVSRFVGQRGGYWHKSIGDAQLATFGAMDNPDELSEIPGIENELKLAHERRRKSHFDNALKAVSSITYCFEELKEKFDISENISLGIAISVGEIEVRVQGDESHKKELDIDGGAVILCSRLEAYTKNMRKAIAPKSSVLVVSPALTPYVEGDKMFHKWEIKSDELQVPNYPEITSLYYHIFRRNERRDLTRRIA